MCDISTKQGVWSTVGPYATYRSVMIYDVVSILKASNKQLNLNGYPRQSHVHGFAEFRNGKSFYKSDCKICLRCNSNFIQRGSEIPQGGPCIYHHGKCYQGIWTCCNRFRSSEGCTVERSHVHSDNFGDPIGFVRTRPTRNNQNGVFAIDCEMSYTVFGLELTRVTIVDHDCNLIYDRYVKPYGTILSYNTRYSGVTAGHLKGVTTTLADVQDYIVNTFSADTIFVGHSLQSDLIALRLIHENVIDTSLLFDHPKGLKYKFALRTLAWQTLGKRIQFGTHDSIEDASTCMRIVLQCFGISIPS